MCLDEEVVMLDIPEAEMLKRSDDPWKDEERSDGNFGHCGAHIVHIYKIPKMIPIGEPDKVNGILWQMSKESDTEFEYEVDVLKHHSTCDELPYDVECALDAHLCHDGWRELLESTQFMEPFTETPEGFWKVWVCWEKSWVDNWSHWGWDYSAYLDFTRIDGKEYEAYV